MNWESIFSDPETPRQTLQQAVQRSKLMGEDYENFMGQRPVANDIWSALAHTANAGVKGYLAGKSDRDANEQWANMFEQDDSGDPLFAGLTERQIKVLKDLGPEQGYAVLAEQAFKAPAEKWETVTDDAGNVLGQRNTVTGEMQKDPRAEQAQWEQRFQMEQEAARRLAAMNNAAGLEKAKLSASGQGKYYAVPSGDGYFLIDKSSGMAVRMGMDESGNPVQIGSPFQPAFNPGTGQPSPLPVLPGGPQPSPGPAGVQTPVGAPSGGGAGIQTPAPGMPAAPVGDLRPVMPPSIDPRAQEEAARAKKAGTLAGEREGSLPERLKAAKSAMSELEAQQGVVQQDIDRAIALAQSGGVGPLGTTGWGSLMSAVPGSDAGNLASTLNTIKANIGFDKLQAMREASPTGGALGQVSERENVLLQSVLGALDQSQSQDQFVANLQRLKQVLAERQQVRRQAFEQDFGGVRQPQLGTGPRPGTVEDGYRFKGGNPADPNNWEPM